MIETNEYLEMAILLATTYAILAFIKVTICLFHLPTAARTMMIFNPAMGTVFSYVTMALCIICVVPFIVPSSLRAEGWKFFIAYSEEEVTEQIALGFKNRADRED